MRRLRLGKIGWMVVLVPFLVTSGGSTQEVEKEKTAPASTVAKKPDNPPATPIVGKPAEGTPAVSPDERAIRDAAKVFLEAFNRGDAQAVASHWTTDGEYVDEEGQRFVGRANIQREYEDFFRDNPGVTMRLTIDSIRLLNADSAIEDGTAMIGPAGGGVPGIMSRYTAIHVRQDGRWFMASVRDSRVDVPSESGRLQDLEPLVGTWSALSKDIRLDVTCRWIADKSFLERSHAVSASGKIVSSGVDILGIDLATQQITSWSFVSGGGHAVGIWVASEQGWTIESVGLMPDGMPTSAVYVIRRVDANTLGWKSEQRVVGDLYLPDMPELLLKRKEPK